MKIKRWMRNWQARFGSLGVELVVADVAQSSLVVDVPERTVVLAPWLKLSAAEKILRKVYRWWQHQPDMAEGELCALMSC